MHYQLLQIDRRLVNINFRTNLTTLQLYQGLEEYQEFIEKWIELVDTDYGPAYGAELPVIRSELELLVSRLEEYRSRGLASDELNQMLVTWESLTPSLQRLEALGTDEVDPDDLQHFQELMPHIDDLFQKMEATILATQASVIEELETSQRMIYHLNWLSWVTIGVGLALCLLVSGIIIRSISKPLGHLTVGTRKIAKGEFSFQAIEKGDDEVVELAQGFNRMARRLGELDQLKMDFVSHVSHELKAPLAAMQETTRSLLDEIPGKLNPQQKKILQLQSKSSDRLSSLIHNLLDLSKLEAGMMQYDFVEADLRELIQTTVEEYQGLYFEKNLKVITSLQEIPAFVRIDEYRCSQILGNLISNAVKFSNEGGEIKISLEPHEKPPKDWSKMVREQLVQKSRGYYAVMVTDRGPGVSDEDKDRIFEKFYSVKPEKRIRGQGTGLGLAISRRIAEAHGGFIWVEDNPGGGSSFIFAVPAIEKG
jgi:two-component system sensor histidine kinase GlrK